MKRTDLLLARHAPLGRCRTSAPNLRTPGAGAGRWNLAVFLSFTTAELLVKGITCLAGYPPRSNHNAAHALMRLIDLLERTHRSPFLLTATTKHH